MSKKMVIGVSIVLVVALAVVAFLFLKPKQYEVINVIGAKATFDNPAIAEILNEKYGVSVTVLTNSGLNQFKQDGKVDYNGVDVIFGGSASFADELAISYPDGLPNSKGNPIPVPGSVPTIAQSPLTLHVKTENGDLAAFVAADLFDKENDFYSISSENLLKIINCMNTNSDWSSIGVNIPGVCRVGFSNPTKSSGGRYTLAYLASCQVSPESLCSQTVTVDQLPSVMESLMNAVEHSGKKSGDNDSLEFYYDWANSQSAAERIMFAYESAPVSWLNTPNVPEKYKDQASKSIAIIYPEYTFMSTQVGVALSDKGKKLVEIMTTDQDIISALNSQIGFRAGYGGSLPRIMPSINPNPSFTIISDPKADVTKAIIDAVCARWPDNPGCSK